MYGWQHGSVLRAGRGGCIPQARSIKPTDNMFIADTHHSSNIKMFNCRGEISGSRALFCSYSLSLALPAPETPCSTALVRHQTGTGLKCTAVSTPSWDVADRGLVQSLCCSFQWAALPGPSKAALRFLGSHWHYPTSVSRCSSRLQRAVSLNDARHRAAGHCTSHTPSRTFSL